RGPKPVDLRNLDLWEFEFYKAFYLLRDGVPLPPSKMPPPLGLSRFEIKMMIERLKRMDSAMFWLTTRRIAVEMGERLNLKQPPISIDLQWSEHQRKEQISSLERILTPRRIAHEKRRKIWSDLIRATTYTALRKACGRWARLPDVRGQGLTPFPD